jgi:TIR domain
MPKIFISYRREDSSYPAGAIARRLAAVFGKNSVVLDVDNIPAGQDFREYIRQALDDCDMFLALIGRHWLSSRDEQGENRLANPNDWVRLELEAALRRESRIPVIPVLLDNIPPLKVEQLPEALKDLAYRQAHAVRPPADFDQDLENLVEKIRTQQKSTKSAARRVPVGKSGGGGKRRVVFAAAVMAVVAVLAWGIFLAWPVGRHGHVPVGNVASNAGEKPESKPPVNAAAAEKIAASIGGGSNQQQKTMREQIEAELAATKKAGANTTAAAGASAKADEDLVMTPLSRVVDVLAARIAAAVRGAGQTAVNLGVYANTNGAASSGIGLERALTEALGKLGITVGKTAGIVASAEFGPNWLHVAKRKIPIVKFDCRVWREADNKTLLNTAGESFQRDFAKGPLFVADAGDIATLCQATFACPPSMFGAMPDFPVGDALGERRATYVQIQKSQILTTDSMETAPYAIEVLVANMPADVPSTVPEALRPLPKLDYRAVEPVLANGRPFVSLQRNQVFAVRVFNNSPSPAAYRLSVDGVNAFEFSDFKGRVGGDWVLPAKSSNTIYGWARKEGEATDHAVLSDRFHSGHYPDAAFSEDVRMLPFAVGNTGGVTVSFRAAWNDNASERSADEPDWGSGSASARGAMNSAGKVESWHIGLCRAAISFQYSMQRLEPPEADKNPPLSPKGELTLP